jgi:hypothetical protein
MIRMLPMGADRLGRGRVCFAAAWLAATLALPVITQAQQTAPSIRSGYSLARETNLVGTVSSVVENSTTGPLGTNVMVQTSSGLIDVHVGSASYLKSNHLDLAAGDTVRVVGELFSTGSGTVFLARIVQKGATAIAVRSTKGMPLWQSGTRLQSSSKPRGGAL